MTHDERFTCMGCEMRLIAEGADAPAIAGARALLDAIDARLSRFHAGSELARLNADPRPVVPASALLRAAVGAAIWAAERTGGLADPTLLGDLERCGYAVSRRAPELPLATALLGAPPRRPARSRGDARWRAVRIDNDAGTIARPPGLRLDTAGTTKGLAADAAAALLARVDAWTRIVVDCGGDLRVVAPAAAPVAVAVEHPLTGGVAATLTVADGGVATSGLARRLWHGPAHHLLDPATGEPAWTGLISATALAPTAREAEALATEALLRGPAGARPVLARGGGVLIRDDGRVERVRAAPRPRVRTEGGRVRWAA